MGSRQKKAKVPTSHREDQYRRRGDTSRPIGTRLPVRKGRKRRERDLKNRSITGCKGGNFEEETLREASDCPLRGKEGRREGDGISLNRRRDKCIMKNLFVEESGGGYREGCIPYRIRNSGKIPSIYYLIERKKKKRKVPLPFIRVERPKKEILQSGVADPVVNILQQGRNRQR